MTTTTQHITGDNLSMEQLWRGDDAGSYAGYDDARRAKIVAIAEYIGDYLKPGLSAERMAEQLMSIAEESDQICGDSVSGEVASRYTRSGNPLVFEV